MNTADKKTTKPVSKPSPRATSKAATGKSAKPASQAAANKVTKKTTRATSKAAGKKSTKALRQSAAKANPIRDYELIILFSAREEVYKTSLQKVLELFKEHDTKITWKEDLGVRPLAYRIQKQLNGHYLVFYINTPAQQVKHLSRALHLEEALLRVMLIAHDKKSLKYLEKRRRDLAKKKLAKRTEAKKPAEKKPVAQ